MSLCQQRSTVKTMVFPVVMLCMWELDQKEGWVPKNWCFWIVVLGSLLRVLYCKENNQSILKKISPEYSLEGLMLKLKLQYFGHLTQRADSLEKTLILGKIECKRRRQERTWHYWFNGHEFEQAPGDGGGQGSLVCSSPWGLKESDTTEWLNNSNRTLNPCRLHWKSGVLTAGPPGRSPNSPFL